MILISHQGHLPSECLGNWNVTVLASIVAPQVGGGGGVDSGPDLRDPWTHYMARREQSFHACLQNTYGVCIYFSRLVSNLGGSLLWPASVLTKPIVQLYKELIIN